MKVKVVDVDPDIPGLAQDLLKIEDDQKFPEVDPVPKASIEKGHLEMDIEEMKGREVVVVEIETLVGVKKDQKQIDVWEYLG